MTRRKGELTAAGVDRGWPHQVALPADQVTGANYNKRALTICEKMLGPEHADTAQSLNNLGVLLQDQGDLAGAQPPFEPNASASSWTNRPIVPPVGPPSWIMANCGALLISTAKPSLFP
jgi:Tetratricopeptide repeat